MERSVLVRRMAPFAVFATVLAVVAVAGTRLGGRDGASSSRDLDPLPIGARARNEAAGAPQDSRSGASTSALYWGGEIVVPDRLLQGLPTEGPVHSVTAGDPSVDRIAALARALGVTGVVQNDAEGWTVSGVEQTLRVYRQPGTPWYLGSDKGVVVGEPRTVDPVAPDEQPDERPSEQPEEQPADGNDTPVAQDDPCPPDSCTEPAPAPECPKPTDGTEPACAPGPEPTKPPQPSDDEARATAQRVFDAAGLTGPTVTLHDAWSGKEVVGSPVVGGLPTVGFETRVTVELGGKIPYANGYLGTTALKGDYPLLAPREAVERGGAYGAPRALSDAAPCEAGQPCPTPAPREATALRLGLTFLTSYDPAEGAFLAPAWLLTFEGPWEEPVLALPDRYLATPPPASDAPAPDGGTVDGGGSGGSTGTAGSTEPAK